GGQVFPVVFPGFDRNGVLLAPRFAQLQEVAFRLFAGAGLIDLFQIGHERLAVFPGDILQAVADLMDDAALDFGLQKDGMDGFFEAGQPINAGDEDVLDPTSLEVGDDTQPEVGAFCSIADPVAGYVTMPVQVYTQDNVDRNIFNSALPAQLEVKPIKIDNRIDGGQRAILPGFHQRPDFVRDGPNRIGRDLDAVGLREQVLDVASGHPLAVHGEDFLFQFVRAGL